MKIIQASEAIPGTEYYFYAPEYGGLNCTPVVFTGKIKKEAYREWTIKEDVYVFEKHGPNGIELEEYLPWAQLIEVAEIVRFEEHLEEIMEELLP